MPAADEGGGVSVADGGVGGISEDGDIDDARDDTEDATDSDSLSGSNVEMECEVDNVKFEGNKEDAEAVTESGSAGSAEPLTLECTNALFGNEDDVGAVSTEDLIDRGEVSRSDALTLKLLFLPVATLLTILGAPILTPTVALPGGAPFTTAFLSACIATACRTPNPTSLTNDATLPFALKFRSTVRTSGFKVSSDILASPPFEIPCTGGKARS